MKTAYVLRTDEFNCDLVSNIPLFIWEVLALWHSHRESVETTELERHWQ